MVTIADMPQGEMMEVETVAVPKKLLADLVDLWNKKAHRSYGSPNHSHEVPGVWDSDNGELAGKPCAECAMYDEARRILETQPESTDQQPAP